MTELKRGIVLPVVKCFALGLMRLILAPFSETLRLEITTLSFKF